MSSTPTTNYRVVARAAAQKALEEHQPRSCDSCGAESGKPFVVAYGKEVSRETTRSGSTETTVTTYDGIGAYVASICDDCLGQHRRFMMQREIIYLVIAAVITVVLIGVAISSSGTAGTSAVIGACLTGLLALFFVIQLNITRSNHEKVGQNKARRLHDSRYKEQGFDTFWTDEVQGL